LNNPVTNLKLKDLRGQEDIKLELDMIMRSAEKTGEPMEHILFIGPPGTGKTLIANIISNELEREIKSLYAPSIKKGEEIVDQLLSVDRGSLIFIDEVHSLGLKASEALYQAMEYYKVDLLIGPKKIARAFELPKFTLVAATTELGLIPRPLRDRFSTVFRLKLYEPGEMKAVYHTLTEQYGVNITDNAIKYLVHFANGTPRIAKHYVKAAKHYMLVNDLTIFRKSDLPKLLKILGIDSYGLNRTDREIIKALFPEKCYSLKSLSQIIRLADNTVKESEEMLLKRKLISISSRGRQLTDAGRNYWDKIGRSYGASS
jgi:Holliday junction DNA helicase RuvB